MQAVIRRKLSMARRVLAFEQAHPSGDSSHQGVVAKLTTIIGRVDTVFSRQHLGRLAEHSALARRKGTRRILRMRLRHLVTVAAIVSRDDTSFLETFAAPKYYGPNREFIGIARAFLEKATLHAEPLIAAGLGNNFLDDLANAINAFEIASAEADDGRREHVTARADFSELARDVANCVGILDGLNAERFAREPEVLAAWTSARNVYGPIRRKTQVEIPEVAGYLPPPAAPGASQLAA